MIYQVEVMLNKGFKDIHGHNIRNDISYIGIKDKPEVRYSPLFYIEGNIELYEINKIAKNLLIDPVTQNCSIRSIASKNAQAKNSQTKSQGHEVEVWFKPGVTDVVSESIIKAIKDLGIDKELKVKTGHKYIFTGSVSLNSVKQITERLLVNNIIQKYTIR
ncbi:MAG: phosphoribosylformylglycinamidine synthase subunit PurS [Elusimicrobia bacterium]|nr:phosphoribosylformylglycinamidine synthase subunit PurS [Candidatus Liberimonas magnetica]